LISRVFSTMPLERPPTLPPEQWFAVW
jgi:hypothetical protein